MPIFSRNHLNKPRIDQSAVPCFIDKKVGRKCSFDALSFLMRKIRRDLARDLCDFYCWFRHCRKQGL